MLRLRIATFNLENLDDRPDTDPPLAARIPVLRPLLCQLAADIVCLQEVNAQKPGQGKKRRLAALDAVLEDTPYTDFHRIYTISRRRGDPTDVHNLVILSRWPFHEHRQIQHELVPPPRYRAITAVPSVMRSSDVKWDRPLLYAAIALPNGPILHVINLHLRAPRASFIPGQKLSPSSWKTVAGWAEGLYLAAIKGAGQALEARLLVDQIFEHEPDALIAVAGDLNAESHDTPVRAIYGDLADTGNEALAGRVLNSIENDVPKDRRFSVLYHGKRLMLDHVLVSRALKTFHRHAEIVNESLMDEYCAYINGIHPGTSFHAPIVAEFELPDA